MQFNKSCIILLFLAASPGPSWCILVALYAHATNFVALQGRAKSATGAFKGQPKEINLKVE